MGRKRSNPDLDASGNGDVATSKPAESKTDKFRRLAIKRVPRALKAIAAVANLSSKATYDYMPSQADRIITSLQDAVADLAGRFEGGVQKPEEWKLD